MDAEEAKGYTPKATLGRPPSCVIRQLLQRLVLPCRIRRSKLHLAMVGIMVPLAPSCHQKGHVISLMYAMFACRRRMDVRHVLRDRRRKNNPLWGLLRWCGCLDRAILFALEGQPFGLMWQYCLPVGGLVGSSSFLSFSPNH